MATSVLITQCLQHDFVAPIAPHAPLPNVLHIGREESERLVGVEPDRGPLAQLMLWAAGQSDSDLHIIHIRDWHDAEDPTQHSHLSQFGLHCIAGSPGAELIFGQSAGLQRANVHFVNSITLNDFEGGTDLGGLLESIRAPRDAEPLRVGVVGVWTEAKVTFLLYELLTRCRINDLATCSALTAGSCRAQHFIALDQLRRILGVNVFDSIGEFTRWLLPDGTPLQADRLTRGAGPRLTLNGCQPLNETDTAVLSWLYRNSSSVELFPLTGGFSGASVFRTHSRDSLGHAQASSVLKLGPRELIASERVAFEQVEPVLGNNAPTIRGFVDFETRAGIRFAYAAMDEGNVRSFQSLYRDNPDQDRINAVLQHVFQSILGRFQAAAVYERLPLLEYYTFNAGSAGPIRESIARLLGPAAARSSTLVFPGGYKVGNIADFYGTHCASLSVSGAEAHYVCYVHGDLNGANILIDERENVWLIDFLHAHRGHCLRDLAKLENDMMFIVTDLSNADELEEALRITRALRCVRDLRAPLPAAVEGVRRPGLVRAWQTIRTLRSFAGRFCRDDRDPMQLQIALLRYAAHTLSFDESSDLQKQWALAVAGGYADDLVRTSLENRELRVDWLPTDAMPAGFGRLGITICPGRADRGRDLATDLRTLVAQDVKRLLSLITRNEMRRTGVLQLRTSALERGLDVWQESVPDQHAPTPDQMNALATWIEDGLQRGQNTVLHCLGGLGRAGTVAACILVRQGMDPDRAIGVVRDVRGPRAVETNVQERFIHDYARRQRQQV